MYVSILIPCFNAERWIGQCIESALAQTWSEKEIIVLDDGSTDGSLDQIRKFDGVIRWETSRNRGSSAARNRLLELASGEWLQYLDADDCLLAEHVARQAAAAQRAPKIDVVYSPVTMEHWLHEENATVNRNAEVVGPSNDHLKPPRREGLAVHDP